MRDGTPDIYILKRLDISSQFENDNYQRQVKDNSGLYKTVFRNVPVLNYIKRVWAELQ